MQVTITGTVNMVRGIATRLLAGGHEITLLRYEAGEGLAREFDGSVFAGTVGDPSPDDVIVLAIPPYEAARPVVQQYGDALSGKVVVDITNPVDWQTFDGLVTPSGSSAAKEISKSPEGARVVKAFKPTFASTPVEGSVAGQPLDVYIASDDDGAKEKVARLVRDGGLVAIDAGPLRRARQLEGLGFLGITLQQPMRLSFQSAWKLAS